MSRDAELTKRFRRIVTPAERSAAAKRFQQRQHKRIMHLQGVINSALEDLERGNVDSAQMTLARFSTST